MTSCANTMDNNPYARITIEEATQPETGHFIGVALRAPTYKLHIFLWVGYLCVCSVSVSVSVSLCACTSWCCGIPAYMLHAN